MRDLLVRLDTKVDGISTQLDRMNQRADGHENRIAALEVTSAGRAALVQQHHDALKRVDNLEKWQTETVAELRGASKLATVMKGLAVTTFAILAYVGYEIVVEPTPQTAVTVQQLAPKTGE